MTRLMLLFLFLAFSIFQASANDEEFINASEARYSRFIPSSAYMAQNCAPTTHADYLNVPLQKCKYKSLNTSSEVVLALPSAHRLALWTITACRDALATNVERCAKNLETRVKRASGGQFVVSGFVIEPRSVLGGTSNEPLCFLFKDGVTIRTTNFRTRPPVNGGCPSLTSEMTNAVKAFSYARVASTTRQEFSLAFQAPVLNDLEGIKFLSAVRNEFVAAWFNPRNKLFSGAAISDKRAGKYF